MEKVIYAAVIKINKGVKIIWGIYFNYEKHILFN